MSENVTETPETSDQPVAEETPQEQASSSNMASGPLVLRVKRSVTDEVRPTVTLHTKRLRLNEPGTESDGGGGPAVFHLAGTLEDTSDEAQLSRLISQAIYEGERPPPLDSDTSDGARRRPRRRRRRRYRVVGRSDSKLSATKRKCSPRTSDDEDLEASVGSASGPTSNKCVCVVDVEPDEELEAAGGWQQQREEDLYAPSLEEYRRQLDGLTMNGQPMVCEEVSPLDAMLPMVQDGDDDVDGRYVYDLYVTSSASMVPGELLLHDDAGEDDDRWSLTLEDYDEQYPRLGDCNPVWQRRQARAMMEDELESNPDSESNWRNDYPDLDRGEVYDAEEFDLWMVGREPERLARDSDDDDELRDYADDEDLGRALREMELSRGVEIEECLDDDGDAEMDLERARERRHGAETSTARQSVRQMFAELQADLRRQRDCL